MPSSFEALGAREDNAAMLNAAGVPVGITTGDTHNARKLRQIAGNAVRSGLPREAAIAAITRVPAEALGMGARYGTLAPGKVANLVVWSGDPLALLAGCATGSPPRGGSAPPRRRGSREAQDGRSEQGAG
jgi:imidazolonepropionase-like amidohydrolase